MVKSPYNKKSAKAKKDWVCYAKVPSGTNKDRIWSFNFFLINSFVHVPLKIEDFQRDMNERVDQRWHSLAIFQRTMSLYASFSFKIFDFNQLITIFDCSSIFCPLKIFDFQRTRLFRFSWAKIKKLNIATPAS